MGIRNYNAEFKNSTYRKHHAAIFGGPHGLKVEAVVDLIRSLDALKQLVVSHPKNAEWVDQVDRTHSSMRTDRLLPGDATHLAIAMMHARSLVTADEEFAKVGGISPAKLNMVLLKPPPRAVTPTRPSGSPRQSRPKPRAKPARRGKRRR